VNLGYAIVNTAGKLNTMMRVGLAQRRFQNGAGFVKFFKNFRFKDYSSQFAKLASDVREWGGSFFTVVKHVKSEVSVYRLATKFLIPTVALAFRVFAVQGIKNDVGQVLDSISNSSAKCNSFAVWLLPVKMGGSGGWTIGGLAPGLLMDVGRRMAIRILVKWDWLRSVLESETAELTAYEYAAASAADDSASVAQLCLG